jgi:hypothetical protein
MPMWQLKDEGEFKLYFFLMQCTIFMLIVKLTLRQALRIVYCHK